MILLQFTLPQGREYEVGPNELVYMSLKWVEPNGDEKLGQIHAPIPEGSRVLEAFIENSL